MARRGRQETSGGRVTSVKRGGRNSRSERDTRVTLPMTPPPAVVSPVDSPAETDRSCCSRGAGGKFRVRLPAPAAEVEAPVCASRNRSVKLLPRRHPRLSLTRSRRCSLRSPGKSAGNLAASTPSLRTKAGTMLERWGDRYCLIGPYNPQHRAAGI